MNEPLIFHVDMEAFLAPVEQHANSHQKDHLLAVCVDDRNMLFTTLYETRSHRIHSGKSLKKKKRITSSAMIFPDHYQKCLWLSLHLYNTLVSFTPLIEPYSNDAVFLDLSGNREAQADPLGFARRIKHRIAVDFKLLCSIGIGSNRLIAKVASDCMKPNGLTMIKPEKMIDWLHSLVIERLPGIGVKETEYLHGLNIGTIGELALVDEAVLVSWFGNNGSLLYKMAWGREDGMVHPKLIPLKSVSQK